MSKARFINPTFHAILCFSMTPILSLFPWNYPCFSKVLEWSRDSSFLNIIFWLSPVFIFLLRLATSRHTPCTSCFRPWQSSTSTIVIFLVAHDIVLISDDAVSICGRNMSFLRMRVWVIQELSKLQKCEQIK